MSTSQLRRHANRLGLRLVRYRETSPWFHAYGPFALIDNQTNAVVHYGLDVADVAEIVAGCHPIRG